MIIYVDVLLVLNLFFDFSLLLAVNNTLKRNASLKRIILASLVGSSSLIILWLKISTLLLFLLKLVLGCFMCMIAYGIKDKKYLIQNISYLYMTSTVLGGFLYFLNLSFCTSNYGLIFTEDSIHISYLFLIIFSPIMLYIYVRQIKSSSNYNCYYNVTVTFLDKTTLCLNSYLDTGNKLEDLVTHKKIILVNNKIIPKDKIKNIMYVPYNSLNHTGIIKCFKINSLKIKNKESKDYLIGISEGKLMKDGIDCILNDACRKDLL